MSNRPVIFKDCLDEWKATEEDVGLDKWKVNKEDKKIDGAIRVLGGWSKTEEGVCGVSLEGAWPGYCGDLAIYEFEGERKKPLAVWERQGAALGWWVQLVENAGKGTGKEKKLTCYNKSSWLYLHLMLSYLPLNSVAVLGLAAV
ncbi:hypothetical protein C8R42DRAFT_648952 [Lentinula raphanica]|nr:hypothetical protein C8R42DRAFT_648952 [Lentinula raphanica]